MIERSVLLEKNKAFLNGNLVFEFSQPDNSAFLTALYKHLEINYPRFYKMDNMCKLGFLAAELLLQESSAYTGYKKEDVAIILQNENSSLDTDLRYYETVTEIASPALFVYTLPNILIGELCIRYGFKGESIFFLNKKGETGEMFDYVNHLLENDLAQTCLCGWVDYLDEQYKAVLLWVGKNRNGELFTLNTLDKLYNQ